MIVNEYVCINFDMKLSVVDVDFLKIRLSVYIVDKKLVIVYKARHTHKCLYKVLPKYSKIQVLPGIISCRLMKYNKQAIELNSLLINNMPKDGYE